MKGTVVYTYCQANGGKSGSGYSGCSKKGQAISPCNSEGHSTPACVRDSHQLPALWNAVSASTRPLHRLSCV